MEQTNSNVKKLTKIKGLYDKKFTSFNMDGAWRAVFGDAEKEGAWLIYGMEKHGKTWFALMLANYLSRFEKVTYISAEEGLSKSLQDVCLRVGISAKNKRIDFIEYEPLTVIYDLLKARNAANIVLMDNVTFYNEELKNGALRRLLLDFPKVLFIFLAHEERGEPYTATAKMVRRIAKIIIRVNGLTAFVDGRCPGGKLIIDEQKAQLYHGNSILN